jgi:hypothetical protein
MRGTGGGPGGQEGLLGDARGAGEEKEFGGYARGIGEMQEGFGGCKMSLWGNRGWGNKKGVVGSIGRCSERDLGGGGK